MRKIMNGSSCPYRTSWPFARRTLWRVLVVAIYLICFRATTSWADEFPTPIFDHEHSLFAVRDGSADVRSSVLAFSPARRGPSLLPAAATANEVAVARALDKAAPSATGNFGTLIDSLHQLSAANQQVSLTMLSAEVFGNTQTIGLQTGDQFQQRLITRMISNGRFLMGTSFRQASSTAPTVDSLLDNGARGQFQQDSSNAWVQSYGAATNLMSDNNTSDTYYSQMGLMGGFDLASDETGSIGVAVSETYTDFSGFANGGQMVGNQFGLYAVKQNDDAYVLGSANYGYDIFHTTRNVLIGADNQTDRAQYNANQFGTYLEAGLKYDVGLIRFQPLVGLQYLYLNQQGFNESGGSTALHVDANQAESLRTSLGGRFIVEQIKGPRGAIWTPYWHGRWVSELLDNDRQVNASFVGAPVGTGFVTHGDHLGSNYGIIGKGLQVQFNDRVSAFANYDGMFGSRIETVTVAGGMIFVW